VQNSKQLMAYVSLVAGAAAIALVLLPAPREAATGWVVPATVLAALCLGLEFVDVQTAMGGRVSPTGVTHVGLALLAPPPVPAMIVGFGILVEQVARRRPIRKVVFNVANHVLSMTVISAIAWAGAVGSTWLARNPDVWAATRAIAMVGAYYIVNAGLTAGAISLERGRHYFHTFAAISRSTVLPDVAGATLGLLVGYVLQSASGWAILLVLPAALVARAQATIRLLEDETLLAVAELADTLDARDPSTFQHSTRVATYAVELAVAMGLDDRQIDLVGLAARVHDLGKIGIKDAILLKAGPLEPDERAEIERHAILGASILNRFRLYREGARIVRSHHERWDGRGYPDGLEGTGIPIGARVIAVADAFDAMTTDRPYREGMSLQRAAAELLAGAGRQWDPTVVATFMRLRSSTVPQVRAASHILEPPPQSARSDGKAASMATR
jgi:putative nucleotidyltransferase with HDIG domain